jgi:hypothetical protein
MPDQQQDSNTQYVWEVIGQSGARFLMRKQVPESKEAPTGWLGRIHDLGRNDEADRGLSPAQWLEIWFKFGYFEHADNYDYLDAGGDYEFLRHD